MTANSSSTPRGGRVRDIAMLDLFAGVGGLSEGFRQADPRFRARRAVEIEPRAAAGYALNHDTEVHQGSVREWMHEDNVPSVDLVIGGPPCQGFSALGARRLDDERNALWRDYAEVVVRARPRYFVLENVPQFHSSPQFDMFRAMTGPGGVLEQYRIEAHLVNAVQYGTPQHRRRVIVIGSHRDLPDPGFPEPEVDPQRWRTVGDTIRGLPLPGALPAGRSHPMPEGRPQPGPFRSDELHVARKYSDLSLRRFAEIPYGGNRFDLPEDLKCAAWRTHRSGSGDVMGRLRWEHPSVTIRTEFTKPEKGRYLHPVHDRSLSAHEGALLQGFPDHYRFVGPMTEIVRQIGNAVPIPLGRAIGRHLLPHLLRS